MMKKTFTFGLFVALMLGSSAELRAATNPISVYLPAGDKVLPAPPERGTPIWLRDSARYYQERAVRRTARKVETQDSVLLKVLGVTKKVGTSTTVDSLIAIKRQPYISWLQTYLNANTATVKSNYPKLATLDTLCTSMKSYNTHEDLYRVRLRPYYFFPGDKTKSATQAEDSYPSGHGYYSGLFGACMSYVDPNFSKEVLNNSTTFGDQRLILGAHWESDVTAGRILGNLAFALALHDATFAKKLSDATAEMSGKEGHSVSFADARSHFQYLPNGKDVTDAPLTPDTFRWEADSMLYMQALALRESARGEQAKLDTAYSTWLARFSVDSLLGVDLTNKYLFPNLHEMVAVCHDMAVYAAAASRNHLRVAPNTYFAKGQTQTSAISEKAYMAWALGLALAYIKPDTVGAKIARTALAMADANYILGNYWQSEVENSEKLGAIGFAIAMRNPYFRALADAAIQELAYAKTIKVVPDDKGNKPLEETQTAVNTVLNECLNKTKDLLVGRTIYCDGYYNTLCLPFDISSADWADESKNPLAAGTLKKFLNATIDANDVLNIEIEDADSIEAGKPYLIKFADGDDIVNPLFKNIKVTTTTAGATEKEAMDCKGLFAPDTIVKEANAQYLILGEKNTLYKATKADANDYIRGFRAYFKVKDTPAGAAIRKAKSAQLTEKTMPTGEESIYKFTNLQIYKLIDDGQVIIIRDGVKYGVDGRVR